MSLTRDFNGKVARRGFFAGALAGLGGWAGWRWSREAQSTSSRVVDSNTASSWQYDVSAYAESNPADVLYQEAGEFFVAMKRVTRIECGSGNRIGIAGDREIEFFSTQGHLIQRLPLDRPPHSVDLSQDGVIRVLTANRLLVFDSELHEVHRSPPFNERTFFTSLTANPNFLYLADAGNREVVVCDPRGREVDRFGKKDGTRGNPGFEVPGPYFDLTVDGSDRLSIANPGRLRIETYSLDGVHESGWGGSGMEPDRFCGCCNPSYFTRLRNGRFITSEKGLARIHVYSAQGEFLGVVAGPDHLFAHPSTSNPVGGGKPSGAVFDVTVDAEDNVLVLDPIRKSVRTFKPISSHA